MITDPGRRARLLAVKLEALVRSHGTLDGDVAPAEYARGAALMAESSAWVLVDGSGSLGQPLAWAIRRGADALHVLAEEGTGTMARRAAAFRLPIDVWFVEGRELLAAILEPLPVPPPLPEEHAAFVPLIEAAGAEPVVEHGVLGGEVYGLEVCRVVDVAGGPRLEVGIGAHDREAFQLLHGDRPTVDALASVVEAVGAHRRPGAAPHALNRIAVERGLRARLVAEPGLVGAARVAAVAPPVPRRNLKDPSPCVAVAEIAGGAVGLVCTSGVDLDAVPFAVDVRESLGLTDVRVVVTAADAMPIQHDLAAALEEPVRISTLVT